MMDILGGTFLVVGAVFIFLAAVGVLRFDDIYARMHAGAKAPALGVLGIGVGAALTIRTTEAAVAVVLVIILQLIAGPVGSHILGRSVYRRLQPELDGVDELAEAELAAEAAEAAESAGAADPDDDVTPD